MRHNCAARSGRTLRLQSSSYVRLFRPAAEGRVVEDYEGLDVGDRVRVELVRTDVERGFIDFRARR